jgi:transcriptional regulator with GAF, ATPase, and Fis domain
LVKSAVVQPGDRITVGTAVFLLAGEEDTSRQSDVEITDDSLDDRAITAIDAPFAQHRPENMAALLRFITNIGWIRDPESLQWQFLGQLFELLPAERGAIVLVGEDGGVNQTIAWNYRHGPKVAVSVSRTVVQRVIETRQALCFNNRFQGSELANIESVAASQAFSLLAAPLLIGDRVLGVVYLDSQSRTSRFERVHLELLAGLSGVAALALANATQIARLQNENRVLRARSRTVGLTGESQAIAKVRELIVKAAQSDVTVVLCGESGTGKEVAARALHESSLRCEQPFLAINCAALTESLMESELFGHEKGAFTGAATQKQGLFEVADHGTIFLDEIGELPFSLQAKLLSFLL